MSFRRLLAGAAASASLLAPAFGATQAHDQIRFGAEMARAGNWREAIFRWKKALEADPDNPRLHNNLAVGYETLGEWEKADAEYRKALATGSSSKEIRENFAYFQNFYDQVKKRRAEPGAGDKKADPAKQDKADAQDEAGAPDEAAGGGRQAP
jgi:type IV pilus assembly protein PilF